MFGLLACAGVDLAAFLVAVPLVWEDRMKYLFVGGKADGRRIEVKGDIRFQRVRVPRESWISDPAAHETDDYNGVKVRSPSSAWMVFVHVDLNEDMVLEYLIDGYGVVCE